MGADISWIFEARAKPGKRAEVEQAAAELVQAFTDEPGTLGYQWSITDDGAIAVRERYADSEAALSHLRRFNADWLERMLTIIDPIGTTVWGEPSEELRAALGEDATFHTSLGGFVR